MHLLLLPFKLHVQPILDLMVVREESGIQSPLCEFFCFLLTCLPEVWIFFLFILKHLQLM